MNNIGQKIRELRKEQNLTLRELAKKASISFSYLGDIERGRTNPSLETLRNIAKALRIPASFLLELSEKNTAPKESFLFKETSPDSLTVEEALDMVLKSPHVMFDGKPVGEMDEDILMDIRDTVVAILKYKANLKKAVAGMRGVLSDCLAVVAGMG